jgi:cysteine desulfurase
MIYLDNHTTTQPCGPAVERMLFYLKEAWTLPNSLNAHSSKISQNLEGLYLPIYELVGADLEDTFIFGSSSAEAVNHVVQASYLQHTRKEGKNQFITSKIEDAPLLFSLQRLEESFGCTVKRAPIQVDGLIDVDALEKLITPKTALVSISWAHGLTGVIQPVERIAQICKEKGVALHVDATYALGKVFISLKDIPISYLTFSADRIHAPKSCCGLFISKHASLPPFLLGGKEQKGMRASHFDMPSFAALSAACQQASLTQDQMSLETVRLRDNLQSEILKKVPGSEALFYGSLRLPNTLVLYVPGVWHEALLYALSRKSVFVSFGGGFCQLLSQVLLAAGFDSSRAHSSLSFSLSRYTTEEEIERAASIISQEALKLQKIGPRETV